MVVLLTAVLGALVIEGWLPVILTTISLIVIMLSALWTWVKMQIQSSNPSGGFLDLLIIINGRSFFQDKVFGKNTLFDVST